MVTIMALAERTADHMISSSRPMNGYLGSNAVATLPDLALNVIKGMAGMMMNPTNMFREMAAVMTNPMNMFSLGERLLSGRVESGRRNGVRNGGVPPKSDDVD